MESSNIVLLRPAVSGEVFLKKVVDILHEENIAEDAISSIDPSKLALKYLTGYQYKGMADCDYSAQTASDLEVTINDNKKTIKSGTPISGSVDNIAFDIVVPCPTKDERAWVRQMCDRLGYATYGDSITIPDTNAVEEEAIGDFSVNPLDFWVKYSNAILDDMFSEPAYETASNSVLLYEDLGLISPEMAAEMLKMGVSSSINITNLKVKTRNSLQEYGKKMLIPCYVLEFQYNGKDYYVAACACEADLPYIYHLPVQALVDITPEEQVEQEMPQKVKTLKLVRWGWIIAVAAVFINFVLALVCLALWYGAKWYFTRELNVRAQEIENARAEASANIRKKLEAQLKVN